MKRAVNLGGGPDAGSNARKAPVDHFGLENNDLIPQVDHSITVGEFYEKGSGRPDHLHLIPQQQTPNEEVTP